MTPEGTHSQSSLLLPFLFALSPPLFLKMSILLLIQIFAACRITLYPALSIVAAANSIFANISPLASPHRWKNDDASTMGSNPPIML